MGARSIRCTYSGARVPPRFTFTINLMLFMGFPLAQDDKQTGGGISRLPFLSLLVLRDLDGSFDLEGLLAANINFDLRRLGFGLLGQANHQHALVTVGAYLPRIHSAGKRERADKA